YSLSGKRVVIMVVHNPWGQAHADTFKKAIAATHATLLQEIDLPNFDNNDIQRELSLVQPLHPDAILTAMNYGDYAVFMKKIKDFKITAKLLAHSNLADTFFAGNIEADLMDGVTVYKFSAPNDSFIANFQKAYGAMPDTYSDTAYDAVYVIKQAIEN